MKEEIKNFKTKAVSQRFQANYKTMFSFCFKCRKNTESKKPKVEKIKKGRIMLSSNCAVFGNKKSRFIKEQEASAF